MSSEIACIQAEKIKSRSLPFDYSLWKLGVLCIIITIQTDSPLQDTIKWDSLALLHLLKPEQ